MPICWKSKMELAVIGIHDTTAPVFLLLSHTSNWIGRQDFTTV